MLLSELLEATRISKLNPGSFINVTNNPICELSVVFSRVTAGAGIVIVHFAASPDWWQVIMIRLPGHTGSVGISWAPFDINKKNINAGYEASSENMNHCYSTQMAI